MKSFNPLRGEPEQQRTLVWVGYDSHALYFAFRCLDAEPSKIRSTVTRRDNIGNDDWVGVSLDSTGAGQLAYHMFVNPGGIQMDAIQGVAEDPSPDWIWQSAGKVDAEGYTVEIRLPLESIRFRAVESDAFEVQVNNRYPVFFTEKRPFFMEGLGLFNLAGSGGDATMRAAVHTRRIIAPDAGAKLTGSSGRYTFGTLFATDASVGPDTHRRFIVARGIRNHGEGQHLGILVTDTKHLADHNGVIAADFALKHGASFRWNGYAVVDLGELQRLGDAIGFNLVIELCWQGAPPERYCLRGYNSRQSRNLEAFDLQRALIPCAPSCLMPSKTSRRNTTS